MTLTHLHILAVSPNSETCSALKKQLSANRHIGRLEITPHLADAHDYIKKHKPQLLIIDLTGQEEDAFLFIETVNYNQSQNNKTVIFGLHEELNASIIIKAVSSGVKEFIHYPNDQATLDKVIDKHIEKMSFQEEAPEEEIEAQVISLFSPKGGSGASTVAANLAYELAQIYGAHSTVLIDFDQSYSNMSGLVNVKASVSLTDVEYESAEDYDEQMLDKLIVKHPSGVDLIFASKSIMDDNDPIPEGLIVQTIAFLKERYKYIIIDIPSRVIDSYHQLAVTESNRLLVVAAMDIQTLYRTRQYLELAKQHIEADKIHLLLNRSDLKGCVGLSPQEIESQFKHPIFFRLPNNWAIVVEAVSVGDFIGKLDNSNPLSKALNQLAYQISGRINYNQAQDEHDNKRGSLLSIIKRRNKVCP